MLRWLPIKYGILLWFLLLVWQLIKLIVGSEWSKIWHKANIHVVIWVIVLHVGSGGETYRVDLDQLVHWALEKADLLNWKPYNFCSN